MQRYENMKIEERFLQFFMVIQAKKTAKITAPGLR